MKANLATTIGCLLAIGPVMAATPAFTRKPTASQAGDRTRIEFAVDRECDVAVYIESAKGDIVRHLVAGVLGKNPPEPLQAGSLTQSIEWDGLDDDGKQAAGGPFRVRVGLGLKASWGGTAFADPDKTGPNRVEHITGLAVGPEGRLYVLDRISGWLYWNGTRMHVFRRDGAYEKTIKPFPANLPPERVKAAGAYVNAAGHLTPVIQRPHDFNFYSHKDCQQQPAITADGRIVLAVHSSDGFHFGGPAALGMIDTEGGLPEAAYAGPDLSVGWSRDFPSLAAASDGQAVFLVGAGKGGHAVFRAPLPRRGPLERFFGEIETAGSDNAHLDGPRSVAADGRGLLYVADFGNNRVVVLHEKDGRWAGSFPVEAPFWVAPHPKSGAIYVGSGKSAKHALVLKFSGWRDAAELGRLPLPTTGTSDTRFTWHLALDASAEPAVLWVARGWREMKEPLLRAEEQGGTFSSLVPAGCVLMQWFERPTADPLKKEVLCNGGVGFGSRRLNILDDATGRVRQVSVNLFGDGLTHRLGPDGTIYGCNCGGPVQWFVRDAASNAVARRLPFGAGGTGTTGWERDFFVDRKGEIYVRRRGPEYHGLMTIEHYDRDGRFKRTVLWSVSDGCYGPRVDAKGNLYIMDVIHPLDVPYPQELKAGFRTRSAPDWNAWIYGSVIKFSPAGGAIWFAGSHASPVNFDGWRPGNTAYENVPPKIKDLRVEGGCLTGAIVGKNACVFIPVDTLDTVAVKKFAFRLKNSTAATRAALYYNHVKEDYGTSSKHKHIEIKPHSDFAEYTFDMADQAGWKDIVRWLVFAPADNTDKGTFALDWFRVGEGEKAIEWHFHKDDSPMAKLPAEMRKEKVGSYPRPDGNELQGALWWRFGFSPLGDMARGRALGTPACHCTGSDFDVDIFGRVFAPDTGRFRVGVLDTAGNEIMYFGAYGNQDCCGPESYVLDPATNLLRPRKDNDPNNLVSPFAKPEIALGWIVGLAVTDRYAYLNDVINKRILRARLDYAAQETCQIR